MQDSPALDKHQLHYLIFYFISMAHNADPRHHGRGSACSSLPSFGKQVAVFAIPLGCQLRDRHEPQCR